jgi:hypothetical protein
MQNGVARPQSVREAANAEDGTGPGVGSAHLEPDFDVFR